ncbi:MAG: transposase zinc-binding domain-containing protein, partial [Vicinamibacteria bacterium]|nr:transposase zinc-binding domain-containing protein [Vicinamibacteria bacterium]
MEISARTSRSVERQGSLRSVASEGYSRHRPELTALYAIVRDNLETFFGGISDGALEVRVPKHARRELEAYLGCGIPCWRGLARFRCRDCGESRIVSFRCRGRGFCPSCLGRRMCSTAANLMEYVLPPESGLRQWVLTFPFAWRATLARNGALLGSLTRIFEETVQSFYAHRARLEGHGCAKTGSVAVLQRSSADLRLNPHVHAVFLDGAWYEQGDELAFAGLGHLRTTEVGEVLECTIRRIGRHLRHRGLLREDPEEEQDAEVNLAVSAVSGQTPPAGPQWQVRLRPLERRPLAYDKPLCASQDGFTLHAATRAGALDVSGREALLRYVLRPPIAQDKIEPQQDGLI